MKNEAYEYKGCGLRRIWLVSGYRHHETKHGPGTSISDADGLHTAIADHLISKQGKLSSQEFCYLRTFSGFSVFEFGFLVGQDPASIKKMEHGLRWINDFAEIHLRVLVSFKIHKTEPNATWDVMEERVQSAAFSMRPDLCFHFNDANGWQKVNGWH